MSNDRESPLVIKDFHDLRCLLVPVEFPKADSMKSWWFSQMRNDILHNCDMILLFLQVQERLQPYRVDIYAMIDQLRFDVLNVKKACGRKPSDFTPSGRRYKIKHQSSVRANAAGGGGAVPGKLP